MGAVLGLWEVVTLLQSHISESQDQFFVRCLQEAYIDLLSEGVIALAPEEGIRPTKKTKQWIYNFPTLFDSEIYEVVCKGKKLGTVSLSTILRHHLPTQGFPFIDDTYVVKHIDSVKRKIEVTLGVQELYYFRNKVESIYNITKILAYDPKRQIALVEVIKEERILAVDSRTKYLGSVIDHLTQTSRFRGVFVKRKYDLPLCEILTRLFDTLRIDKLIFETMNCVHEQLGEGTLLVDTSNLCFSWMIYCRLTNLNTFFGQSLNGKRV